MYNVKHDYKLQTHCILFHCQGRSERGGVGGVRHPPKKMQPVGKSRQIYVCTNRQIGIHVNWENGKRLKTMKTFKA
jgi:hypothetical protein